MTDNLALIDVWERYWPALARSGLVVFSGRVGDFDRPLPVNVLELFQRRISLLGCSTGDPAAVASFWSQMREQPLALPAELIETFPLEEAARAHERLERGDKLGHYVLTSDCDAATDSSAHHRQVGATSARLPWTTRSRPAWVGALSRAAGGCV